MREIVLDTETTGFDPLSGHRVVELGAVELVDHSPTGRTFHSYVCPERAVPADAVAVHGLTAEFLADKPLFGAVGDELLAFVGDAPLVAHNAGFDIGFLNAELKRAAKPPVIERVIDKAGVATSSPRVRCIGRRASRRAVHFRHHANLSSRHHRFFKGRPRNQPVRGSARVRRTSQQVEDVLFLDLPGRLAKALLRLDSVEKSAGRGKVSMTQRELGQMIGMSRESTNE